MQAKNKVLYWLLALTVTPMAMQAQQEDAAGWLTLSVEKKLNRHFSLGFLNQYAFNQNYSETGYFFFDGGLEYKYNDHVSVSLNYRLNNFRNRDNFYEERNSWYADLSLSKGFGPFSLGWRSRYQRQYYGGFFSENARSPLVVNRNRFTLRYKINWYYSLFVSEELFTRFYPEWQLTSWRTTAGFSRQWNLHHKVELTYAIQQQVNRKSKRRDFITGLAYYYKF